MALMVLNDEQVRNLLENLSREEADDLVHSLKCALHDYSTGQQPIRNGFVHQPERTVLNCRARGTATVFVPSANPLGHGVKGKIEPSILLAGKQQHLQDD